MSFAPMNTTPVSEASEPTLTAAEKVAVKRLEDMLTYRRPANSATEEAWVKKFIDPLAGCVDVTENGTDEAGNRWFVVGQDHGGTMFTAHTDSVHRSEGRQKTQTNAGVITLAAKEASNCLGADDASGCWIMSEMIRAGVPGQYVFFRGEEVGGVGSRFMAEDTPQMVAGVQRCISFDRRGVSSVITHQGWGRCCSDEFADALAMALCNDELLYAPDDTGIFTDSANFVGLIPECTNISVGYDCEHGTKESQDVWHLVHLLRQLVTIDWQALPTARDPSVVDDDEWGYRYDFTPSHKDLGYDYHGVRLSDLTAYEIEEMNFDDLLEIVIGTDPIEIADTLQDLAYTVRKHQTH